MTTKQSSRSQGKTQSKQTGIETQHVLLPQLLPSVVPFASAFLLENIRPVSKKALSQADKQIMQRVQKEPKRSHNEKKLQQFLRYYAALKYNRTHYRPRRPVHDLVQIFPFQYNMVPLIENDKLTYAKVISRAALWYTYWKDAGMVDNLMLDTLLRLIQPMGPSIPKKLWDTNSLEAIALVGMVIGRPSTEPSYRDYDKIMKELIKIYNDQDYSEYRNAIKILMIAVIWRYRSGRVHDWKHMTQQDENKYLQQTGIKRTQLMKTTYPV